jgi:hypothetical protein
MKPFLDPFPFRNPENRSSIGEVIARITNGEPVVESHTRAALEKMTTTRLRELKKKYEGLVVKGDRDAARELADIRGLLRAKGAGSVLDEATEGDTHGGGATSVKRKTPAATAKKFRGVPAPVVGVPTTPRGASPLKVSEACWTGYTARGLKRKGNRMVPDCVKEATPCETAALERLKAANAADLKDAPGAEGKAAHKRLHKTIGKVLKGQ